MKQQNLTFPFTDDSHLSVLMTALNDVHQWFELEVHLGLRHSALHSIEDYRMCDIRRQVSDGYVGDKWSRK